MRSSDHELTGLFEAVVVKPREGEVHELRMERHLTQLAETIGAVAHPNVFSTNFEYDPEDEGETGTQP